MIILTADQFDRQLVWVLHPHDPQLTSAACHFKCIDKEVGGIKRMRHRAVQDLIGRAIVDRNFRDQLLNGNRDKAIAEFDLSDDERRAIRSIEAHSLEAFAGEVDSWLRVNDDGNRSRTSSRFSLFK